LLIRDLAAVLYKKSEFLIKLKGFGSYYGNIILVAQKIDD